jgi:hypothetical protein
MPEDVNINLDRGYDSAKSHALLAELGFTAEIARKGVPAPIQAGKRWVVERSHSWLSLAAVGRRHLVLPLAASGAQLRSDTYSAPDSHIVR